MPGELVEENGSIPAGAGEPDSKIVFAAIGKVYPRRCGGTIGTRPIDSDHWGLSPQVRGNPPAGPGSAICDGSIPAGAGEPRRSPGSCPAWRVYPRRCGGTAPRVTKNTDHTGLSPQVRGNRIGQVRQVERLGSIPAGAGEPYSISLISLPSRVYPRRCGGTQMMEYGSRAETGLSPQVRGNRQGPAPSERDVGSIPAGAGEPTRRRPRSRRSRVYPRRCGGTAGSRTRSAAPSGLSPQVRGNPRLLVQVRGRGGSIPAGAGEPGATRTGFAARTVYPRRCGGTQATRAEAAALLGLSPQVRGNPVQLPQLFLIPGSIPAGAGEPAAGPAVRGGAGVYPRRCGGTRRAGDTDRPASGLSPQVRGNPGSLRREADAGGSIPAGAGEPR